MNGDLGLAEMLKVGLESSRMETPPDRPSNIESSRLFNLLFSFVWEECLCSKDGEFSRCA